MIFKGLVIASEDASYAGKQGRKELQKLTCLDAEAVKLKNTVDVELPREEFSRLAGDPMGQTIEFDVSDIDFFRNRIRFLAKVRTGKKA